MWDSVSSEQSRAQTNPGVFNAPCQQTCLHVFICWQTAGGQLLLNYELWLGKQRADNQFTLPVHTIKFSEKQLQETIQRSSAAIRLTLVQHSYQFTYLCLRSEWENVGQCLADKNSKSETHNKYRILLQLMKIKTTFRLSGSTVQRFSA